MRANVSAKRPIPDVKSPGRSSRWLSDVSRDSSTTRRVTMIARIPIGTLMKKIQLQPMCWVMSPPARGPIARAMADTPAQIPIAIPRCRGGNVAVIIESVAGFMSAEPAPWTTRAPISQPALVARPQKSDATVKITSPTMKIRRRPNMSASLPPVSMRTPKVSA